eukprot:CAMPEP_0119553386 /NCGR_PEP_ID=MMETSP1352-20130426/6154_1 /TAXON_ID=265584 /ORGANISM="Stauroneis constricta, Strain CCMP1120" /LENGTH=240 /DNA_ID=CAMNT_0007599785 /DNA_START=136 /DNA_END=855 /DNA_ORIENTATION=-
MAEHEIECTDTETVAFLDDPVPVAEFQAPNERTHQPKPKQGRRRIILRLFLVAISFLCFILATHNAEGPVFLRSSKHHHDDTIPNSLCIPGGGYSAMFHRFGQLQTIPKEQLLNQTNVCISAGCLALFARLRDWDADEMIDCFTNLQQLHVDGEIEFQDGMPMFIDELIGELVDQDGADPLPPWASSQLVIVTTKAEAYADDDDSDDDDSRKSSVSSGSIESGSTHMTNNMENNTAMDDD